MAQDLERLKQRIPLLEYLQRHNWKPCRAGTRQELVGLCPFHRETRPSFYVNAHKNLFYCHGCGRGGDLIRFVQLFLNLPFRQSVRHLEQELTPAPHPSCWSTRLPSIGFNSIAIPKPPPISSSADCTILLSSKSLASVMLPAETYGVISLLWDIHSNCSWRWA